MSSRLSLIGVSFQRLWGLSLKLLVKSVRFLGGSLHDAHDAIGIGPNANMARQKVFEALVTTNDKHQTAFESGQLRLPTVRIVRHGTFAYYRRWRGERMNVSAGQMKVPIVMTDPDSLEWLMEQVVREP